MKMGSACSAALGLLTFVALPIACSADSGKDTAGSGATGIGGGAATSGTGGVGNGTGNGGGINLDSGSGASGGSSLVDGSACAAETQTANLVPLDLYIMLDKSGSMLTSGGWDPVVTALNAFVGDSASKDLGVGLQYFPGSPECVSGTYENPAVPIAALPGNATPISTSLTNAAPGGQTPTLPALQGAMDQMTAWLLQNPTHAGVVVLATDGIPNDCASTVDKVAQVALSGASDNPKILTFVIGVGSNLTALNQIAQAGGTGNAFLVDTAGNVTQQFIDALNAIRGGAIACEYLIPTPEGGTIDFGKVNVQYTPGTGDKEFFPKVENKAACPPSGDGWYYDNPANPTKVILCQSTCDKIEADGQAEIGVAFGCTTIVP